MTKLRRWSALRRGVLVLATYLVGSALVDPETGALACVASLFVGLQERNASASYTSRVMTVQSFFFAGVILVAGLLDRVWVAPVAILTLTAVAAGRAAYHDKAMSRMFGDVMPVAAFLGVSVVELGDVPVMTMAVLLGGLAQAVLARLSTRIEEDIMERRPVAAALVAVADHLDDALPRRRRTTGRAAEDRLAAAVSVLAASDLASARRHHLRRVLTDADLLRQEASAVRTRQALDLPVGDRSQVEAAMANASRALRSLATALTSVGVPGRFNAKAEAAIAELYPARLEAERLLAIPDVDPTARYLARRTVRLYRHVAALVAVAASRSKRRSRRVGEGMSQYLLHPTRRDRVVGWRLGAATVASFLVAIALDLPHGAWVASTTVALLRPDYRALTADTVARALGTAGAAALALPLVWATGNSEALDVVVVFLMSTLTFAVMAVNEGLYVMTSTLVAVFARATVGEDPLSAASVRVLDVVVGSLIAVGFLLLIPVTHGRRLARDLAAYCDATAAWLDGVARRAAGRKPKHVKERRRAMRDARVGVEHGIELRVVEPQGPGISAMRAEKVFSAVHTAARAAVAAERSLTHGEVADPSAVRLATDAASSLRLLGDRLRRPDQPREDPPPVPPDEPQDDVSRLLRHCSDAARSALAVGSTREPAGQGRARRPAAGRRP